MAIVVDQTKVSTQDQVVRKEFPERWDTLLNLLYKAHNKDRALEGKSPIGKDAFWGIVKNIHKNEDFFDGSF